MVNNDCRERVEGMARAGWTTAVSGVLRSANDCSQHMNWTRLQFANSSANSHIRIHVFRTRWAPTVLVSATANQVVTLTRVTNECVVAGCRVTGSTCCSCRSVRVSAGHYGSVSFCSVQCSCCKQTQTHRRISARAAVSIFISDLPLILYARYSTVFTARCYACAVLAMGLCLSVCLSQVGVLLKRLNLGSHKHLHFAPPFIVS